MFLFTKYLNSPAGLLFGVIKPNEVLYNVTGVEHVMLIFTLENGIK